MRKEAKSKLISLVTSLKLWEIHDPGYYRKKMLQKSQVWGCGGPGFAKPAKNRER